MCFNASIEQSIIYACTIVLFGFHLFITKRNESKSLHELSEMYAKIDEIQRDVNAMSMDRIK